MHDRHGVRRALHVDRPVVAALAPYVRGMAAYDFVLDAPGLHRGLPSTGLTFVLPVGLPIDVGWHGAPPTRATRWSCVSGLHTAPAAIHHDGRQSGVQLGLTPLGARALLGMPARAIAGELVEVGEVAPALADLPERLADAPTWHERLRIVEARLLHVLARTAVRAPRPEVGWALRRLSERAPVGRVAEEVGLSRRHLGELFRGEYGLTPKQYQRVARFEVGAGELSRQVRVLSRQARPGRASLARIAADCGYADQAHLTREWNEMAGCSPTAWLRAELPFLQDDVDGPAPP